MKDLVIKGFVSLVLLFCYDYCLAQEFKNEAGDREKLFVYKVKQIDEFFERFNNDENSFIRQMYKLHNTAYSLNREKLIKSLFNYEGKSWDKNAMDSFVKQALKIKMPTIANWYGENWFAEANCRFQYNSSEIDIPLILKIETDEKKRSKWMIVGVKPSLLKDQDNTNTPVVIRKFKNQFINPASHGSNFIELETALNDKEHLSDYFENAFFYRNNALPFYNAVLKNKIRLLYVKDVKYHFLNVENYIFTVDLFVRESLNSGWLINDVKAVTQKEKENYKKLLLGE